jgi:hypothetical protein
MAVRCCERETKSSGVVLSAAKDLSAFLLHLTFGTPRENRMAITLTVTDVDPGNTLIYVFGTVAFSGTYTNGTGDTVNWQSISEQLGIAGQPVATSMGNPAFGPTQASFTVQGGTPNQYNLSQGAAPTNWVMRGYAAGGTEFSTGSYPSSASSDKVVFAAQFRRLT